MPAFERVLGGDADSGPPRRNRYGPAAPPEGLDAGTQGRPPSPSSIRARTPFAGARRGARSGGQQFASPGDPAARAAVENYRARAGRNCRKRGMDRRCELGDRCAVAPRTHGRRPAGRAIILGIRRRGSGGPQDSCGEALRAPNQPAERVYESDYGGIMISLAGKAARITGGSRGIGAAAVKLFAQAGADVVFSYNSAKEAAKQVEQEAAKHGTRVEAFKADVGKHDDNRKLVEHTIKRLGRLDILVPNAGVWNLDDLPIEKMSEKQWDDMIRVNLKSVYSVIHFGVPHMIKQKSGKIIPISSTAGQRGESLHTHYGASKGGIISLTKGLASELARHNILVNSVAPGWVATDMSNDVLNSKAGQKMVAAAIPLGRAATAEEIAGPILFLASDLANFMTGEVINVNGGSVLCG